MNQYARTQDRQPRRRQQEDAGAGHGSASFCCRIRILLHGLFSSLLRYLPRYLFAYR